MRWVAPASRLRFLKIEDELDDNVPGGDTYREIAYNEHAGVGYLRFEFYNGATSTSQCSRLREGYAHACAQEHTKVIVLLGGDDYFSNGIHLTESLPRPCKRSIATATALTSMRLSWRRSPRS